MYVCTCVHVNTVCVVITSKGMLWAGVAAEMMTDKVIVTHGASGCVRESKCVCVCVCVCVICQLCLQERERERDMYCMWLYVLWSDLGRLRCGCWGWSLACRGVAVRGTAHRGGPTLDQWWRSRGSWCRRFHWAGPGTSGCSPGWNMARSCSLWKRQKSFVCSRLISLLID